MDKEALAAADARVDIRAGAGALGTAARRGRTRADGWKAQESDTRTWKSLLTHAYDGEKADFVTTTTAKDAVLARDKTMYDDRVDTSRKSRDEGAHGERRRKGRSVGVRGIRGTSFRDCPASPRTSQEGGTLDGEVTVYLVLEYVTLTRKMYHP